MSSLRLPHLALALSLVGFPLVGCGDKVIPTGGDSDGGTDTGADATPATCDDPGKCGPMPGAPSERCADGSTGGFTGRCIATGPGTCGWEFRACPDLTCDGASGKTCASGSYCHHKDGACGEGAGTCEPKPVGCGKNYQPMCGCDGVTYGNPCLAASAGVSVLYAGPCLLTGKTCGGGEPPACGPGEYCHFPDEKGCYPGAIGTCEKTPEGCTDIYSPVCSCDGHSYPNPCEAARAGASIAFKGECPAPPTGKSCGGFTGATCSPDEYCDYPDGGLCGAADASGTCYPRPSVCDTTYAPVCGCDGRTYSNACTAHGAGTDDAAKGPCSK
jgi:hypothetical protein